MANIRIDIASEFKDKGFKKAEKSTSALEKSFKRLAGTIAATFSAQQIINFGRASVRAFAEDEKAARRLTGTLNNMGLAFEDPRVKAFISNLEATTGVLDDKLRPAMQALLTTTGSVAKSQELLSLAVDMSAQSGVDLETVSRDLARAYVGNTKGLAKYNLGLTRAELSGKSFAEVQQVLNKQFSGANAAFLETYAGKVSMLNVGFANMQETIGKGLVDAFSLLAGNNGIGSATKAMEDFGLAISDTITGISVLINQLKGLPGVSPIIASLANMTNFGILGVIRALGEQTRTAPQPMMNRSMSVSGASDLYTKQERERAKREKDAEKRAKALAALQKKAELDRIKREKEAQQLKRAGTVFDMENIQIVAAMQGKIDAEQRLRLVALLAIQNDMADIAEKTATAVLNLNAPALANLGVMIKSGDSVTDILNKLAIAQAKVALVGLGITDLPKAKNPFEDWFDIIDRILAGLGKVKVAVATISAPSAPVIAPSTPAATAGSALASALSNPGTLTAQITDLTDMRSNVGAGSALGVKLKEQIDEYKSILDTTFGTGQVVDELTKRKAMANQVNVNVTVQGNVTSEQDLTSTILDNIYNYQRAGQGLFLAPTTI